MFAGQAITLWRQCNAVSPAVTATQTGAGASNGIALTVRAVTGAAVYNYGPGPYDYRPQPGASAVRDAKTPAEVTVIPLYTGSLVFGAVCRNDAATLWVPASGTLFSQNVADTVNNASYGTFRSSADGGSATLVTSYAAYKTDWNEVSSPLEITFTPAAGELLVVKVITADAASHAATPQGLASPVLQVHDTTAGHCGCFIWTAIAQSSAPVTVDVYRARGFTTQDAWHGDRALVRRAGPGHPCGM